MLFSRIMRRGWIFLLLMLSPLPSFGQGKSKNINGLQLRGAFTAARAMSAIYGSYDYLEGSKWTPEEAKTYPRFWPNTVVVTVLLDGFYIESGVPKHLLVTSAIPNASDKPDYTCHGCGVLIGLILFGKNREGWRVESSDLQFGEYGQFGHPPAVSVQPLGPNHFGLQIPESFGTQGAVLDSVTIILPKGGQFLKVFTKTIAASWPEQFCSGDVPPDEADGCYAYDGSIETLAAPDAEYYDLVLTKRVYRTTSRRVPEGTTTVTYRFDGSKYVPR